MTMGHLERAWKSQFGMELPSPRIGANHFGRWPIILQPLEVFILCVRCRIYPIFAGFY